MKVFRGACGISVERHLTLIKNKQSHSVYTFWGISLQLLHTLTLILNVEKTFTLVSCHWQYKINSLITLF